MKKVSLILFLFLCGCADHVTLIQAQLLDTVGFWHGLWHGIIFPFAWVISLFNNASIYAIYNNGGWYNFGFFSGVIIIFIIFDEFTRARIRARMKHMLSHTISKKDVGMTYLTSLTEKLKSH